MCLWFLSRPGRGSCPWHLFGGAVLAFTKPSSLALVKNTAFTFAKLYSKLSKTHLIHKTILWPRGYLPRVVMRTLRLREGVVTFPGADSRLVICSLLYYRCLVQSWRIVDPQVFINWKIGTFPGLNSSLRTLCPVFFPLNQHGWAQWLGSSQGHQIIQRVDWVSLAVLISNEDGSF